MVELRTRKREIRGDRTNDHKKLGLRRISCARKFSISDMADTSSDPVCNYADTRFSQWSHASRTPHVSYPLVSCTSFSSSFPSLSFLSITLPSSQNTKLCHPSQSLHATIMRWHRVQHTPSAASAHDCLSSLHSHNYEFTPECSFGFCRTSPHDRLPSASSPGELTGKVTLSHSHSCKLTNQWVESQHPAHGRSTASKFSCQLFPSQPPCISPD